jgi:hypothetical protein
MEEKECTKCHRILSIENFRWKNKKLNKKHSHCKDCMKEAEHQRYLTDSSRKNQILQRAYQHKENNSLLVAKYKAQGCYKCGETREYVLDFHHINPDNKNNTIAHMIKSASLENLLLEIQKCVLLCANCHREFHYLHTQYNITIKDYLGR